MTWIKICGITNLEDAETAVEAGADALGFVFYEKSPRNVAPGRAREIVVKLPAQIEKVGVFVNGAGLDPVGVAREVGLTGIQNSVGFLTPAGQQAPMSVAFAGFSRPPKLFLSFPAAWFLEDPEKIKQLAETNSHLCVDDPARPSSSDGLVDTFFLDSGTLEQPGGSGKSFDWARAAPIAEKMQSGGVKLVVAGGLTPANVAEAMRILKPWGVDVSSGVEARPGKKDAEKVRAFVSAVRESDEIA
jgi:phosphoribosylanthranilate isomerase